MSFIWNPNRIRLPVQAGPVNEELKAILAARPKRTVAERIDELGTIDIDLDDLRWMALNRKGRIQEWALAAIDELEDID